MIPQDVGVHDDVMFPLVMERMPLTHRSSSPFLIFARRLEWRLVYEECEGVTNARWLRARRDVLGLGLLLHCIYSSTAVSNRTLGCIKDA